MGEYDNTWGWQGSVGNGGWGWFDWAAPSHVAAKEGKWGKDEEPQECQGDVSMKCRRYCGKAMSGLVSIC